MRRVTVSAIAILTVFLTAHAAEAQWVREYRPVIVSPQPVTRFYGPVTRVYSPVTRVYTPVTRVYRPPVVVYEPTTIVYSRRRPILGGTVVRTRPGYRRVIW